MKKLTIIIPHYNDIENLNERCLKSLNELDTSLFDIIVVDDASPQPVIINNKYNNMNIKIITLEKIKAPELLDKLELMQVIVSGYLLLIAMIQLLLIMKKQLKN